MTRRLLLSYLSLTIFVLAVLEVPLGVTFARHERRVLSAEVERDAFVIASGAENVLEGTIDKNLQAFVVSYRERTGARALIVDRKGMGVADSDPLSPTAVNFSTRPEIRSALRGDVASGIRRSETLLRNLLYVAVPVASGDRILGAVRITYPTSAVDARIRRTWATLALIAVVVLAAASAVGWRFASSVTRPLRDLERSAVSLAQGDLAARVERSAGPPEVRSLGHTFNDMAARLEELVSSQQAFIADASHQLRTPLTALRLRLETLQEGAPADLRVEAEAAAREAQRLETIVEGLLVLARAEGAHRLRHAVNLPGIVAERLEAWAPFAAERSVSLVDGGTEGVVLELDGACHQILDNLLANALNVAPPSSMVVVNAEANGSTVRLHVVDQGPGMSDEHRGRAFDRFWRASDVDGGSGLGLAIVRQLARLSGGEAGLDRAAGGGVDAWVAFVMADANQEPRST